MELMLLLGCSRQGSHHHAAPSSTGVAVRVWVASLVVPKPSFGARGTRPACSSTSSGGGRALLGKASTSMTTTGMLSSPPSPVPILRLTLLPTHDGRFLLEQHYLGGQGGDVVILGARGCGGGGPASVVVHIISVVVSVVVD